MRKSFANGLMIIHKFGEKMYGGGVLFEFGVG